MAQYSRMGGRAMVAMDEFLKACGAIGPLDLMVENPGRTVMRWRASQPFALIGSDPAADLSLDHPRIDGHHTYLQVIEGEVYWVDLGSQTGTRYGNRIARSGWLVQPHGIGVGPYLIQLAAEQGESVDLAAQADSRPDPFASRPPESDDLPRVILEFRRDTAKPIRWRMRHVLTLVGSSPQCKVRLAAPGVSPFHCSLLRTQAGVWVINLSREGITVNGSSIRVARLEDGDQVRIGDVTVRLFFKSSMATVGQTGPLPRSQVSPNALVAQPILPSMELAPSRSMPAWAGSGRAEGRLHAEQVSTEDEFTAPLLALVLNQFGQMQQQFLDQYQQTTLMMFRALGTMHRDQMEELREQVDALHQLRQSFQSIQAQIASAVPAGSDPPAQEAGNPVPIQPVTSLSSHGENREIGPNDAAIAAALRDAHSSAGTGIEELREKLRISMDKTDDPSVNVHEWMIGRLAAMEEEQRSRWQKILDLVRGR